jgi:DNA polymerase-1
MNLRAMRLRAFITQLQAVFCLNYWRCCRLVYLIDAHSLIYQVFHAVPMMTGPQGQPTNAIYGFTGDMNRLRKRKPEYLICVFDPPGPTFRDHLYDQYKAHRAPMPDDLYPQLAGIRKMLQAMRLPAVEVKGFEADDVMATLATKFAERGFEVAICTSDKDCRQLITDKVHIYNARRDQIFGRAELLTDWGIAPEQVIDLMTMTGDSVDNVPGIPGVGIKTAAKLLQEYKNLAGIVAAIATMKKGKLRENLEAHRQALELSRKLVTLDCNISMEIDWEGWKLQEPEAKALLDFYSECGFHRYATELRTEVAQKMEQTKKGRTLFAMGEEAEAEPIIVSAEGGLHLEEAPWETRYELIDTPAKLTRVMTELRQQKRFAIDLETSDLNPRHTEIAGIALCWKAGEAYYLALKGPADQPTLDQKEVLKKLTPLLEEPSIQKINQNIKYDLAVLHWHGIVAQGIAGDSMLASYLLQAGDRSHNLDDLSRRYLNHSPSTISSLIGEGKNQKRIDELNTADVAQYSAENADIAIRLCDVLEQEVQKHGLDKVYRELEVPLLPVLMEMEETGVRLDTKLLKEISVDFERQIKGLEVEIHRLAGREFNIDSPLQLRVVLFDELKLPKKKKTALTGEASTNQTVLEDLAAEGHELPKKIIAYRQLAKLKGTYIDALPAQIDARTQRLHCLFNQAVAASGRLSSSSPNLQNIPMRTEQGRQIRKAFLPAEGWTLLTADYSQIELRIFAHLSEDPELMKAFKEDRDIHTVVAGQVFNVPEKEVTEDQRRIAKMVNFGVLYGMSGYGLATRLGISQEEAASFIDAYFGNYPGVVAFQERVLGDARRLGYVTTIYGRRREITGIRFKSSYKNRNQPEREAINTVIQGTAADLIKLAMVHIHRRMKQEGLKAHMLLQIHDELVFESDPKDLARLGDLVKHEMLTVLELKVPLGVDVSAGPNWLETEAV